MTNAIKREKRRRAAIEPVIGHAKSDHRMGGNYLAGQAGDAINVVPAAADYNFRRPLAWLSLLLAAIWRTFTALGRSPTIAAAACSIFTGDYLNNLVEQDHRAVERLTG